MLCSLYGSTFIYVACLAIKLRNSQWNNTFVEIDIIDLIFCYLGRNDADAKPHPVLQNKHNKYNGYMVHIVLPEIWMQSVYV